MERFGALWGGKPPTHDPLVQFPLAACGLYYVSVALIARTLRTLVVQHVPSRWRAHLLDTVSTLQLLAWSLENSHIRHFYGDAAYVGILFSLGMWFHFSVTDGSSGNPCAHMLKYAQGKQSASESVIRVLFQIFGGLMSFQLARQLWRLGLHEGHIERFGRIYCETDLNVSPLLGFGIEFLATLLDTTLHLVTLTSFYMCELITKSLFTSYLVLLGLHLTGMYWNPMNATNQTFGCHGTTVFEHFFVYWVGPLSATAASVKLHQLFIARQNIAQKNNSTKREVNGRFTQDEMENMSHNGNEFEEKNMFPNRGVKANVRHRVNVQSEF